jgi:glycosyltransferase involved in cell wall biosynthesis
MAVDKDAALRIAGEPMTRPQPKAGQPFFTVFVPTYNRAATLPRLLESLQRQTFTDFELLLVDDGSTDNTQDLLRNFVQSNPRFETRFFCQPNQGRHIAFNRALEEAKGFLFTTLNSDDFLTDNALERFHYWWHRAEEFAPNIEGVEALCADMNTGQIIGTPFPSSPMVSDHIEVYYRLGCWGDSIRAIRTEVIARYRFPQFPNERYIPPSYLWNQIGFDKHSVVYVNEVLAYKEYRSDGVTRNRIRIRASNPRGAELYFRTFLNAAVKDGRVAYRHLLRNAANWVRYLLFLKPSPVDALKYSWANVPRRDLWLPAVVIGISLWFRDWLLLRKR